MNESMRKIIYYENILEFKQNTQSQLNLKEINNWQLCRTCLTETKEKDVDLEKMCVMDLMEGRFLSVQEMLLKVTPLQLHTHNRIPLKMCRNCLEKTKTLYFFLIQVKKAEDVLRNISEQFKIKADESPTSQDELEKSLDSNDQITDERCDIDENYLSTTIVEEHEISLDGDRLHEEIFNSDETCISSSEAEANEICPKEKEKTCESPASPESLMVANETIMVASEEHLEDAHMENMSPMVANETIMEASEEHLESVDIHMENNCATAECKEPEHSDNDFEIAEDMVHEVYLIEEQLEYKYDPTKNVASKEETDKEYVVIELTREYTRKSCKSETPSRTRKKVHETSKKHRQPRVTKPLLENIKCGVCEKVFNRQLDLVSHVKLNHPNSKAFQCRDCGALFSHTQSLSRHMNTHKPKLNKNTCEYCSKGFVRPDDLRRHIRVHTGERPYACPLCEKSFKQQGEMKQHMTIHLEEKQYACNECDRAFASRNSLYLHRKAHIASSSRDQRVKTYSNKHGLLNHEPQIHGREKYNNNNMVDNQEE